MNRVTIIKQNVDLTGWCNIHEVPKNFLNPVLDYKNVYKFTIGSLGFVLCERHYKQFKKLL